MSGALVPFPTQKGPLKRSGGFTPQGAPALPPGGGQNYQPKAPPKSRGPGISQFVNDAINTEQRVQARIRNGAAPGAARGREYGSTIGGIIGSRVGVRAGTQVGAGLVTAAGVYAPPLVPAAKTTAVGLIVAGGVAGQQLGEEYGGRLGESIGSRFDEPRPTERPVVIPSDPPPFQGGQCNGAAYEVSGTWQLVSNSDPSDIVESTFQTNVYGPIDEIGYAEFWPGGPRNPAVAAVYARNISGSPQVYPAGGSSGDRTLTFTSINVVRTDGQPDDCGDPNPDSDYYTPGRAVRRPTRIVGKAPILPKIDLPSLRPRPPLAPPVDPDTGPDGDPDAGPDVDPDAPGGEDEPPVDPHSPRVPSKPDKPGPKKDPKQPRPDGAPGEEEPEPEKPRPPYSPGDCDPCDRIDELQQKLEELFNQDGKGSVDLGDCKPEEDSEDSEQPVEAPEPEPVFDEDGNQIITNGGGTKTIFAPTSSQKTPLDTNDRTGRSESFSAQGGIEATEEGALEWNGTGLAGLYNFAIAASRSLSLLNQRLACLKGGEEDPVVIYPSDVYSEFELEGRLTLEFSTLDSYPRRSASSSKWSLDIPNPLPEYDWNTHFESFRLLKGSVYGRCIWSESGVRTGAYCSSLEEAQKLIDFIKTLTTSTPLRERITFSGKNNLSTSEVRIIRAVKATIANGEVVDLLCYKPPTNPQ